MRIEAAIVTVDIEKLSCYFYFSTFNHADQQSESSEKPQHEAIAASPIYQHSSDYNIMQESSTGSPEAGSNNNLVYATKKTNWTPLTEKIV